MNGKPPPPTSAPIDRYTDDTSNSRGSVGPSCGAAAGVPARGNGPQPPDRTATASSPPSAASLTLTRRITCRASNQDVSFAHNPMALENLAGRAIAGYRLLERVGEGGTAEVYRAEHPERGACAFKVLRERLRGDPTGVKRFLREAGYGSRVVHPGVVRTYDFGESDGLYYLALEWATGEPLAEFLHREGPLAPADAIPLVRQLADALAAAHAAGIIHRDLKPENIMFDAGTHTVKLLDFGIARDAELPPSSSIWISSTPSSSATNAIESSPRASDPATSVVSYPRARSPAVRYATCSAGPPMFRR